MKPSIESGRAYFDSLGMVFVSNGKEFGDVIKSCFDTKEEAIAFANSWNNYSSPQEAYRIKNQCYKASIALSGIYDGYYIIHICDWILHNKNLFGKRILDIGCDNGILTGFLGLVFPDSHIIAIERNEKSIHIAQELFSHYEIKNVELRNCDASDIKNETFDTVFSSKTLMENNIGSISQIWTKPSYSIFQDIDNSCKDYANVLTSLVGKEGYLVTTERADAAWAILGWLRCLSSNNLSPIENLCSYWVIDELFEPKPFTTIVMKEGTSSSYEEANQVFLTFMKDVSQEDNVNDLITFQKYKDKFIKGYVGYVNNPSEGINDYCYFRCELWTCKNDPKHLIIRQGIPDENIRRTAVVDKIFSEECFNGVIFDIIQMSQDPSLTVMEITKSNGTETQRKCKNVQALLIPGVDEIDPSFSFVLNK